MGAQGLSREVALRIGLAARMLPDTDSAQLVATLVMALGMPLSDEKLSQLTVRNLREADDGRFGDVAMPALKSAMDYLWGKACVAGGVRAPLSVALVERLRSQLAVLSFTRCSDDDVIGMRPVLEQNEFNLYLVDGSDHCMRLTRQHELASGVLVAWKDEDDE